MWDEVWTRFNEALVRLRSNDSELKELELRGNNIDTAEGNTLAEALKVNTTLRILDLNDNYLGEAGITLGDALKTNNSLETLNLQNNRLEKAASAIADALTVNNALRSLDLSKNRLRDAELISLANALKKNDSLQSLSIEKNMIRGNTTGKSFAEALKVNHSLTSLNLNNCQIQDYIVEDLALALKVNCALKSLQLKGNSIFIEAVNALTDALKINQSLQSLNLESNFIEVIKKVKNSDRLIMAITTAVDLLADSLKHNYTLLELRIDKEFISVAKVPVLEQYLNRNNQIHNCLTPLRTFQEKIELDAQALEHAGGELRKLIPGIGAENAPFDDTHVIAESYRLLTALGHLAEGAYFLATAWEILSEPFTHPHLQEIADLAKEQVLFASSAFNTASLDIQKARLQLRLYSLRHFLDKPNMRTQITTSLIALQQPDLIFKVGQVKNISADQLIAYADVIKMANLALRRCAPDSADAKFLAELLKSNHYHPITTKYFWHSPTFLAVLEQRYPQSKTFRLLEDYLLDPRSAHGKSEQPLPILTFPNADDRNKLAEQFKLENYHTEMTKAKPFDFQTQLNEIQQKVATVMQPENLLLSTIRDALVNFLKQPLKDTEGRFFQPRSEEVRHQAQFFQTLLEQQSNTPECAEFVLLLLVKSENPVLLMLKQYIATHCFPMDSPQVAVNLLKETLEPMIPSDLKSNVELTNKLQQAIDNRDLSHTNEILNESVFKSFR